ncbi:MAG: polysaccharide pyruvyl transferase family protein [Clostridium sp.]|nr:polysaccharide pyruvyl transferase family protein [Clostridium sp.]
MKWGIVYYPYGSIYKKQEKTQESINIGDVIQYLACLHLYEAMGIHKEEIVHINRYELCSYSGEYLVVPINCIFNGFSTGMDLTNFSPKIIPVFLGFAVGADYLSPKDIAYLKKFEPIGCRDEFTLNILRKHEIKAWLNGCMTITFDERDRSNERKKVFLVDIPEEVRRYLPYNKEDIEEITHIWSIGPEDVEKDVLMLYEKYKKEARVIVTSRLHCAVPCIAAGIPVVIVKNTFTTPFTWLDSITPIYVKENYASIDWYPPPVDICAIKEKILKNAAEIMRNTFKTYEKTCEISDIYESKSRLEIKNGVYENLIQQIQENWDIQDNIDYAIWGFCLISPSLIEWIKENRPNAKLVTIFDKYRNFTYDGIASEKLDAMEKYSKLKILVTGDAASKELQSNEWFHQWEHDFYCGYV